MRWYAPGRSRSSSSAWATAVRKVTSHRVGASDWYASPRARLRRKASWLTRCALASIVWYVCDQSIGQAHAAPQLLEDDLVLDGQALAQLDEVLARDRQLVLGVGLGRRLERRVVRQARIAAHAVVVLHAALGRQAVVVPAHRVEHLEAAHPLVAGDAVGVRVGEDVPDVQGAAHGGRRSVDGEDLGARLACGRSGRCPAPPTRTPSAPRSRRGWACPARRFALMRRHPIWGSDGCPARATAGVRAGRRASPARAASPGRAGASASLGGLDPLGDGVEPEAAGQAGEGLRQPDALLVALADAGGEGHVELQPGRRAGRAGG